MLPTIFLMAIITVLVLPSILWLYALVDVVINEFINIGIKLAWLLALICFPPIATIFYFLFGTGQKTTKFRAGKPVMLIIFIIPLIIIIAIYFHYITNFGFHQHVPSGSITI
jgi:Phospholipase_D-nuclease N-terminal